MHNSLAYLVHRVSTDQAFRRQLENDPEATLDSCLCSTAHGGQLLATLKENLQHLQVSHESGNRSRTSAREGWTGGPSFTSAAISVTS